MSAIRPSDALELLYSKGFIAYDKMRNLKDATHPSVLNEAMESVESSGAFQEALAVLVDDIHAKSAEAKRREDDLKADSRYALAPEVTGVFVRQFWDSGDYLTEVSRTDFTVPLSYLVENRDRLEEVHDFGDSDWLAFDLGLTTDHEGPFDVTDIEEPIRAWLEATE